MNCCRCRRHCGNRWTHSSPERQRRNLPRRPRPPASWEQHPRRPLLRPRRTGGPRLICCCHLTRRKTVHRRVLRCPRQTCRACSRLGGRSYLLSCHRIRGRSRSPRGCAHPRRGSRLLAPRCRPLGGSLVPTPGCTPLGCTPLGQPGGLGCWLAGCPAGRRQPARATVGRARAMRPSGRHPPSVVRREAPHPAAQQRRAEVAAHPATGWAKPGPSS